MRVGDLVRMLPKNYSSPGHYIPDQWRGLVGVITEDCTDCFNISYVVLVKHPDDPEATEILVSQRDVEVISEP